MFGQLIPAGGGIPIPLLNKRILVGRDTGCDVVIPSKAISDQHCELKLKDGYWWVRDLDSRNGTGINGKKISRKRILPKQVLCVPKMRFRIVYDAPAAKPAEIPDDAMVLNFLAAHSWPLHACCASGPCFTGSQLDVSVSLLVGRGQRN